MKTTGWLSFDFFSRSNSRCELAYVCVQVFRRSTETGECTAWASGNNYGTMPNWDTSSVEDMSGWTGSAFQGFGGKSTFDGDISKWDTGKVTTMYRMFFKLLRSTKPLGIGTQRK